MQRFLASAQIKLAASLAECRIGCNAGGRSLQSGPQGRAVSIYLVCRHVQLLLEHVDKVKGMEGVSQRQAENSVRTPARRTWRDKGILRPCNSMTEPQAFAA